MMEAVDGAEKYGVVHYEESDEDEMRSGPVILERGSYMKMRHKAKERRTKDVQRNPRDANASFDFAAEAEGSLWNVGGDSLDVTFERNSSRGMGPSPTGFGVSPKVTKYRREEQTPPKKKKSFFYE